jgi:hypothetical protein
MKRPRGRQTTATPEAKQAIIDRLTIGEPLADICRDDEMPATRTVSDWKAVDAQFAADFARARDAGHDAIAARLRHTARGVGESTGDVQRDKLIIETDLKLLAKWDKRYSDKLTVKSDSTVTHRHELGNLDTADLEQLEAILAKSERGAGDTGEPVATAVH